MKLQKLLQNKRDKIINVVHPDDINQNKIKINYIEAVFKDYILIII